MITFLRHTQVDVPKGLCYGQTDVPLVSGYLADFEDVSKCLDVSAYRCIVTSPLSRCVALANFLRPHNVPVITDAALMELNFGNWEGQAWNSISQTNQAQSFFNDYVNTPCPNGESFAQLIQRVHELAGAFQFFGQKSNLLIVTHAGPIRAFMSILKGVSPADTFSIDVPFGQPIII